MSPQPRPRSASQDPGGNDAAQHKGKPMPCTFPQDSSPETSPPPPAQPARGTSGSRVAKKASFKTAPSSPTKNAGSTRTAGDDDRPAESPDSMKLGSPSRSPKRAGHDARRTESPDSMNLGSPSRPPKTKRRALSVPVDRTTVKSSAGDARSLSQTRPEDGNGATEDRGRSKNRTPKGRKNNKKDRNDSSSSVLTTASGHAGSTDNADALSDTESAKSTATVKYTGKPDGSKSNIPEIPYRKEPKMTRTKPNPINTAQPQSKSNNLPSPIGFWGGPVSPSNTSETQSSNGDFSPHPRGGNNNGRNGGAGSWLPDSVTQALPSAKDAGKALLAFGYGYYGTQLATTFVLNKKKKAEEAKRLKEAASVDKQFNEMFNELEQKRLSRVPVIEPLDYNDHPDDAAASDTATESEVESTGSAGSGADTPKKNKKSKKKNDNVAGDSKAVDGSLPDQPGAPTSQTPPPGTKRIIRGGNVPYARL